MSDSATLETTLSRILASRETAPAIFRFSEFEALLRQHREIWRIPNRISARELLRTLLEHRMLHEIRATSPNYPDIIRYSWAPPRTPYAIGLALGGRGSYYSHATAAFFRGLTETVPSPLHVNTEQTPKPAPAGQLTQEGIDRAFANQQRTSNRVYSHRTHAYIMLSGKNTQRLGVNTVDSASGERVDATNLERTLIDVTVRPAYAGGPGSVLEMYRRARHRTSVAALLETLQSLNYIYPYHQALGVYLERAGFSDPELAPLRNLGIEFDFYLTHALRDRKYDHAWRVYMPPSF